MNIYSMQQIEKVKTFLSSLFRGSIDGDIQIIREESGDCSFYVPISCDLEIEEERLDARMEELLSIAPYDPNLGIPFVFLVRENHNVYSWAGHP